MTTKAFSLHKSTDYSFQVKESTALRAADLSHFVWRSAISGDITDFTPLLTSMALMMDDTDLDAVVTYKLSAVLIGAIDCICFNSSIF